MSPITRAALRIPAHLHLVCRKCTREVGFEGTQEEAEALAKRAGWVIEWYCPTCNAVARKPLPDELLVCACGSHGALTRAICPRCPAMRHTFHDPEGLTVSMHSTHEQHEAAVACNFSDLVKVDA